jgi:hypothetical protein
MQIERERIAEVDDSSTLRFAIALRTAARTFHSTDPAQCAAILGPSSAASPGRSAAALAAISPALESLLDARTTSRPALAADPDTLRQVKEGLGRSRPEVKSDAPAVDLKIDCDRLLLMYDMAVSQNPDTGAALVRALQGH